MSCKFWIQQKPTVLMCDNQSAIKLSKNPVSRDCTKHIAIRLHIIREKVSEKDIEVIPVA
jgi:hypothetical protein